MHITARSETQNKIETIIIDRIESYMSFNDLTEEGFNSRPSRNVRPVKKIILKKKLIEKILAVKQREIGSVLGI
jgi:hypothetical protein